VISSLSWDGSQPLTSIAAVYGRVLRGAIQVPWVAPLVAAIIFLAVVPRATDLGTELVPDLYQGEFYYDVELAEGTPLEATDAKVLAMEAALLRARDEASLPIAQWYATIGSAPVLGQFRLVDVIRVAAHLQDLRTAGRTGLKQLLHGHGRGEIGKDRCLGR